MIDWDSYDQRLKAQGENIRENRLNRAKYHINKYGRDNPSCKNVKVNGNDMILAINSGTKPYYKTFHTMPDDTVHPGDIVYWNDTAWMVINADFDNELYIDGNLQQCNFKLRWQNKNREIIERDIVTMGATSGVEDKALTTIGNDQLMIYIPFDKDTIKFERDQRFFVSNNQKKPTPYKLTSINTTSNVYNCHGYLQLIVSEDVSHEDDNLILGVCNYKPPNNSDTEENNLYAKIAYKSLKIKSGYSKGTTFCAWFYNQDTKQSNISPIWSINSMFNELLTIKEDGNKITILIDDDSYIGQRINLTLKDNEGNYHEDSITLEVVGLF